MEPRVVIIGGGFAGLYAARVLAGAPLEVTLVDRRNHHLFQPLLYQVATAALDSSDIAAPIRRVLRRQANATVLLAEVRRVGLAAKRVELDHGTLAYEFLIIAAGVTPSWFGRDDWRPHAPGLKTLEDAYEMRARLLRAFEAAERAEDPLERAAWLTFVIVGAGPTGVELAGALREIAQRTLARDFRRFDPRQTRVLLLDVAPRVLPAFPETLARRARAMLERRGVEVRTGVRVEDVSELGVLAGGERIAARTVLWAAGVRGEPLAATLGVELTPDGRIPVEPDLSITGHLEVFVAGDLAALRQDGEWVPGMAPAAIQEGRHAAGNIARALRGERALPFRYRDRGLLATVGRAAAVARISGLDFGGFLAWILWLAVHIAWLIGFRNRLAVLFEWAWAYLTWQRSARVIVGPAAQVRGDGSSPSDH